MKKGKRIWIFGFFLTLMLVTLLMHAPEARADVFTGQVVATEGKMIQVKGPDGKVSVFWLGHKTKFDSRAPFFGDKVRIEYVKDRLKRNAVTRVTILSK